MSRNFFLEGPVQTGKSTLIREVLGDHLSACGGFASQRLTDEAGMLQGFRIGPAADTPLTARVRAGTLPLAWPDGTPCRGVFRCRGEDGCFHGDPGPFAEEGRDYLRRKSGQDLMLLDEIGGIELLCDPFYADLLDLLRSGTPCLGVLKLRENMLRISSGLLEERYDRIRHILQDGSAGSRLLYYDRTGASSGSGISPVAPSLREFVARAFA